MSGTSSSMAITKIKAQVTSREKPIAGAQKILIPGEFGLASNHHAGGNSLPLARCVFAGGI
jgi:hypothetical protein